MQYLFSCLNKLLLISAFFVIYDIKEIASTRCDFKKVIYFLTDNIIKGVVMFSFYIKKLFQKNL